MVNFDFGGGGAEKYMPRATDLVTVFQKSGRWDLMEVGVSGC